MVVIARRIIDEFRCADGWIGIVRNGRFEWLLNRKCNSENDISPHGPEQAHKRHLFASIRKYAANFGLVDHTGMRQRFYLRFPYSKRAVCSGFPEFAAYFRRAFPEVWGKTEICRPDPYFELPRPAVLLQKNGCARRFPFFPALPKNAIKPSVWKRKTCQMYSKSRCHKNRGCPPSGRNLLAELQPMKGFCFSLRL